MKKIILWHLMVVAAACLVLAACGEKKSATEQKDSVGSTVVDTPSDETDENMDKEAAIISTESHLAVLSPENILLPSTLKGFVEVVPEDDGNVYVDFDDHNYPTINLTLKLVKKTSAPSHQVWLVGFAQDEKGRNIEDLNPKSITSREWRSQDSDGGMIKNFLNGDVGETVTFTFSGESNIELFEEDEGKIEDGKMKTSAAAQKFVKFKLTLSE